MVFNKKRLSLLCKNDLLELVDIAHDSISCADLKDLRGIFSKLNRLII
jgi:hypothetical protein